MGMLTSVPASRDAVDDWKEEVIAACLIVKVSGLAVLIYV